jgi:hypothetical protein
MTTQHKAKTKTKTKTNKKLAYKGTSVEVGRWASTIQAQHIHAACSECKSEGWVFISAMAKVKCNASNQPTPAIVPFS